jgi:23S rRNA A2030 N6-methylase RlmJ
MHLADEDLLESSDNEEGIVFDETEEQENARADLMEQAVNKLCNRNCTEADIHNLVHATVRHFHPDRRFDKYFPSMILRRQHLVALMDLHPNDNIIMETDEDDDLVQRI